MPIYEYRCRSCGEISSFFTKSIGTPVEAVCAHCQSRDMQRRMSPFATGKSVQSVQADHPAGIGTPAPDYYKDPRNIGRHVEESFSRHGIEVPQSVRKTIDAAREGKLPKGLDS